MLKLRKLTKEEAIEFDKLLTRQQLALWNNPNKQSKPSFRGRAIAKLQKLTAKELEEHNA
jgi:hypothetical protein